MTKYFTLFAIFAFSFMMYAGEGPATLYYSETCGHCQKVLAYLHRVNKTVNMKNIKVGNNSQELHDLGQHGVPTMVVNGKILTGADEIIDYMKAHPEILQ